MDGIKIRVDLLQKLVSLWSSLIDKTHGSTGNKWVLRTEVFNSSGNAVSGNTETPTMTVYAAGATVAAGKKSVTVITDGTYAGTILTAAASADSVYTFSASPGNTLGAIAITRSAGNFTVITIA
jgi:hypothetical protein